MSKNFLVLLFSCLCLVSNALTTPIHHKSRRPTTIATIRKNNHLLLLRSVQVDDETTQQQQYNAKLAAKFDALLEAVELQQATRLLQENSRQIEMTRERWNLIFEAIEERTKLAEENHEVNTRKLAEFPLISQPRMEMTNMYMTLNRLDELRLFGAIDCQTGRVPAGGSHAVRPSMLEEITQDITLTALTPKPTKTFLYAGLALALVEILASVVMGWNINTLVFITLFVAFLDQALINGSIGEAVVKLSSPGLQTKIREHEAGHFLCAYLLGCPVEGCVLSAWEAFWDVRFGQTRQVTAGTSFFDMTLSQEMNSPSRQVTRSSIDRYSIIVMAGIAAEAINYGRADGGGGDEMALVAFLSNLNGNSGAAAPWNNVTIRNQARWGALQAILLLRHYKPCYDALSKALEEKKPLGECIHAIEQAGRDHNLGPLREPLGYIVEQDDDTEIWVTDKDQLGGGSGEQHEDKQQEAAQNEEQSTTQLITADDPEASMEALQEYKKIMEEKLKDIETRLGNIN